MLLKVDLGGDIKRDIIAGLWHKLCVCVSPGVLPEASGQVHWIWPSHHPHRCHFVQDTGFQAHFVQHKTKCKQIMGHSIAKQYGHSGWPSLICILTLWSKVWETLASYIKYYSVASLTTNKQITDTLKCLNVG